MVILLPHDNGIGRQVSLRNDPRKPLPRIAARVSSVRRPADPRYILVQCSVPPQVKDIRKALVDVISIGFLQNPSARVLRPSFDLLVQPGFAKPLMRYSNMAGINGGKQTTSKARCRAMRGTTVNPRDSRDVSALLLCGRTVSADIDSESSQSLSQAAQKPAIWRRLEMHLYGGQNRGGPLEAKLE